MAKTDALDFMNELDAWSTVDMQRTVAKMMRGVENIMGAVIRASETDIDDKGARRIKDLSGALKSIADSVERYTGIYQWCISQGQTGAHATALEDVLPLLSIDETYQLNEWMRRLEMANNTRQV